MIAMTIEPWAPATNVVLFPVERMRAPSFDEMRDLAPDIWIVLDLAETFRLPSPARDLRDRSDAAMAHFIREYGPFSPAMLNGMQANCVRGAIATARQAHAADRLARAALAAIDDDHIDHVQRRQFEDHADDLLRQAAVLTLRAHERAEEAEGVTRAVAIARRGETWTPRSSAGQTDTPMTVGTASAR
jgi:hypothetical protein